MWNEIITSNNYEVLFQTYDKILKQYTVQLHASITKQNWILGTFSAACFQGNLHIFRLWDARFFNIF